MWSCSTPRSSTSAWTSRSKSRSRSRSRSRSKSRRVGEAPTTCACGAYTLCIATSTKETPMKKVLAWLNENHANLVRGLADLVAIESISTDGEHQKEIEQSAALTCEQMRQA